MTSRRPLHVSPIRLAELTSDAVRLVGDPQTEVTGAGLDSRTVGAGDLYAALPGANVHGARFAAQAVAAGARAVLTDPAGLELMSSSTPTDTDPRAGEVATLVADDPRAVLGGISARIYGEPATKVRTVGITGTNGKTTTTYILDAALRQLGLTTGVIGTIETRVGDQRIVSTRTTPESCDLQALLAAMVEAGVDAVSMEVSSHALALHRVDGVVYDVACFTNLSLDHLDFHHTMEEYAAAKAALFTSARARRGVVCIDDDWGAAVAQKSEIEVVTVANSETRGADWVIRATPGEQDFDLAAADGSRTFSLVSPLPGDFNRTNTAMAALALLLLGHTDDEISTAMTASVTVPGRAERVDLGADAPIVVVDFAHTPDAVASVLGALRAAASGPLVAVLGAGGDRDPGKRPAMGAAAAAHADIVIVTDDNPRHEDPAEIRAQVLAGARAQASAHAVEGREQAIEEALRVAGSTGLVAILGKGHETGQQIGDETHHFDDREATRRAWSRIEQEAR